LTTGRDHDRVYIGVPATARTLGDGGDKLDNCTSFDWIVYVVPKSHNIGDDDCVALRTTTDLTVGVREKVAPESDTGFVALFMIGKIPKECKASPTPNDEKRDFVILRLRTLEVLPLDAAMHQGHNLSRWCRSVTFQTMRPEIGMVKSNDILVLVDPFIIFLVE